MVGHSKSHLQPTRIVDSRNRETTTYRRRPTAEEVERARKGLSSAQQAAQMADQQAREAEQHLSSLLNAASFFHETDITGFGFHLRHTARRHQIALPPAGSDGMWDQRQIPEALWNEAVEGVNRTRDVRVSNPLAADTSSRVQWMNAAYPSRFLSAETDWMPVLDLAAWSTDSTISHQSRVVLLCVSDSEESTVGVRDHINYFAKGQLACRNGFSLRAPSVFAQGEDGRYLWASHIELDLSESDRTDPVGQLAGLDDFLTNGSAPRKTNRSGPVGSQAFPGTAPNSFICLGARASRLHVV